MTRATIVILFACCQSFGQTAAPRAADSIAALSRSFERLVERVGPAVVQVLATGLAAGEESGSAVVRAQRSSGSGVIVDAAGYVVTNAHVVGTARQVQVVLPPPADRLAASKSAIRPPGRVATARVVGLDRETDVAVLQVEQGGLPALRFGDSDSLRQGQLVLALGSPFGLENSVTMGVVSSTARQVRPDDPMIYVQTDAPINPGNSGGPLVNAAGEVVGLNTFIVSSSGSSAGVGFAAPSNIVRTVYEQVRKHGRVRRGQIGVQVQTITPALARALGLGRDWGVLISDVLPGSSAETAGIEIKDIVLTLDGKPLENGRQFGVNIYQRAGATATLELLRGERRIGKQVAVLERPGDPGELLSAVSRNSAIVSKLGVAAVDLDEKSAPLLPSLRRLSGVVVAGATAAPAGLSEGLAAADVIYSVNERKVGSVAELEAALQGARRGDAVAVQVERGGRLQYVVVEIQ